MNASACGSSCPRGTPARRVALQALLHAVQHPPCSQYLRSCKRSSEISKTWYRTSSPAGVTCALHLQTSGGGQIDDLVDLGLLHQCALAKGVTLLRPELALADAALRLVSAARFVRGRGFGRHFGVQRDPLAQPSDFALLLGHQLHQCVDHFMALRQSLELGHIDSLEISWNRLGRLDGGSSAP